MHIQGFIFVQVVSSSFSRMTLSFFLSPICAADFAVKIRDTVTKHLGPEYSSEVVYEKNARKDDPQMRRPNIDLAKKILKWEPKVSLEEGLKKTIAHFQSDMDTRSLRDFYQHSQLKFD